MPHAKVLLCLLTTTLALIAQGQVLNFRHFGLEEGLPNTNVWSINQDAQGYLWVGTNQGFYRFNGLEFDHDFGIDLQRQRIADIIRISDSVLLAHSETPNMLYRIQSDQSLEIESIETPIVTSNRIVAGNGDNTYYSWSEKGVYHYSDTGTLLVHAGVKHARYFKTGKDIWITGAYGIGLSRVEQQKLVPFQEEILGTQEIFKLFLGRSKDELWIHTKEGFHLFHDSGGHTFYELSFGSIFRGNDYLIDQNDRIWFCGVHTGFQIFDPKAGRLVENNLTELLQDVQVTCLFIDAQGTIWIGTGGYGLYQVPTGFVRSLDVHNGLPGLSVTAMAESMNRDMMLIGTNSGIGYVNKITKNAVHPTEIGLTAGELPRFSGYVMCLDNWSDHIVYSQSPADLRGGCIASGQDRFWQTHAASVCTDHDDALITGAWGRIRIFPKSEYCALPNHASIKRLDLPRQARVNAMAITQDTVWAGTADGLFRFNLDDTTLAPVSMLPSNDTAMLHCSDVLVDDLDRLWVATRTGLFCRTGSKWRRYTRQDGLSSDICTSLAWDGESLWVGSYQGVNRLNGEVFESVSLQSGVISAEVSTLHYDAEHRTLWLGTVRGLSYFNVDEWKPEQRVLDLWLNELEVMNDTAVPLTGSIDLDHNQNNIRFSIELLDLWGARNSTLHYRLIGASQKWAIAAKPEVEFFGLAPGQYTLEVKATSPMGRSEIARASFQITAPYWSTWWFALLVLIAITAVIALFARVRIRQIRLDERRQRITFQRMFQLEQQALAAAMNPHFIFNSLHSIQELFTRHGDAQAIDYVGELAQLMRKNLDSVTQKEVSLRDVVDQLKRYLQLEKVRFGERLQYSISVSNELLAENPAIPAMLIQPFIENALKHGITKSTKRGKVSVGFREMGDLLEITIIDNGVGLNHAQPDASGGDRVSRGINIVRKRLALHSPKNRLDMQELSDPDGAVIGTQVTLCIYTGSREAKSPDQAGTTSN